MTVALTPALALEYVTALSADIRAAVILDADGVVLAGDEGLARAARGLPAGAQFEGRTDTGGVYVAQNNTHTIVVVTGPFALARVTRLDLRTALSALGGQTPPDDPPGPLEPALVEALLGAVQLGFRLPRAN